MPNWCQNRIVIPKEKFKNFKRKFMNDKLAKPSDDDGIRYRFDLNRVLRQPDYVQKGPLDSQDTRPNWYTWRIDNWNTKWNALHTAVVFQENTVEIDFDTAWNQAGDSILMEICRRLKCNVKHVFYEPGCEIYGVNFYEYHPDETDSAFVFDCVTSSEIDSDDLYRTVLEEFYGDSDYVNEELQRLLEEV